MKNTIIFFLLFSLNFIFSQSGSKLTFIPLKVIGKISDPEKITELRKDSELQGDFFFIKNWIDATNTAQKAIFYKKDTSYIVYQLPTEDADFNSFDLSDNGRFITYTTDYHFGGRSHYEAKSHFQIIDLHHLNVVTLNIFFTTEDWEGENAAVISKCESEMGLKANIVSIKRKHTKNLNYKEYFEENCIASGKYKIGNGKLIKIKSRH